MTRLSLRRHIRRTWKTSARRAIGLARGRQPAILLYHRIAEESFDPWGLAVSPAYFAGQMEWLARNRVVLPLDEFAALHSRGRLATDAIAVTFDDGYACTLKQAAPVLQRLALAATVFVPVDLIERGGEFWWDELAAIVLGCETDALKLDEHSYAIPLADASDWLWQPGRSPSTPRQRLFHTIWSRLHKLAPSERDAAMAELRAQAGSSKPRESHAPLNPGQIRSAARSGVSLGSHALTHSSLPVLSSGAKAHEIAESRRRCAALTGSAPSSFAYPHGDLDRESVRLVEDAGYACACATADAPVNRNSNLFALPRLRVGNWEAAHLRDMLGG